MRTIQKGYRGLLAVLFLSLAACGGDGLDWELGTLPDVIEDEPLSTEEEALLSNRITEALNYGLNLAGTPYGWWKGGAIPSGPPMWAVNQPAPSVAYVQDRTTNCTGLTNLMIRKVGARIPGEGGTGAYAATFANVRTRFNINANYPRGTLVGRFYRNVSDQGHVAVVLGNGNVLQAFDGPGVNARYTLRQSHDGGYYEYAVLPRYWLK